MKYYYGIFEKNWADEFDYTENFICTENEIIEFDNLKLNLKNTYVNFYFGTNEGWNEVKTEKLFNATKFYEISETTFNELKKFLRVGLPYFVDSEIISKEDDEYEL